MQIDLYSQSGEKKGHIEVPDEIFGAKVNHTLIHQALLRELSNRRNPVAHTKTKGQVSGSNKKPYKQKHTGRARQGSTRNPHYIGGGVVFGPNNTRNFELDMPKKQRRGALFAALSAKAKDHAVFALEKYHHEIPKTKNVATLLKKLPVEKDALFVLPEINHVFVRSSRNMPNVKSVLVNFLNIHDLLKFEKIVFFQEALPLLQSLYLKK